MRRLLIMLSLVLLLAGCAAAEVDALEYKNDAFNVAIGGVVNGFEFAADMKIGAPRTEGTELAGNLRDMEMTFQSPATLKGIRIERKNGTVTVSSGGISIENPNIAGWLAAAELLIPEGRINNIAVITENDIRLSVVEMTLLNGAPLMLYVDCNTGFPIKIKSGGTEIHIAAIDRAE